MVSTVRLNDPATQLQAPPPRLSRDGERAVIWLDGEQDIATVPGVADVLARAIAADEGDVTVDMSGMTFIDAAMIGVLVRGRNFLALDSRQLTLRSPRAFVGCVLAVCGLSALVEPLSDEGAPSTSPSSGARVRS